MSELRDIGEKRFIREVLAQYATTARREQIDDCIVIDPSEIWGVSDLPLLVYSMDHPGRIQRFLPAGLADRFYGRWVAACTCNDVLAMGARPRGFALDLAVPLDVSTDLVHQLYQGISEVLDTYGARLEGGNIDVNDRVETVGYCWGTVDRAAIVRRRGARPGDIIAVTTELGLGWSAHLLRRSDRMGLLPLAVQQALRDYNLMPLAPHEAILAVADKLPGALTSGMDLTDGLVEFLHTIEEASGCGAIVDERLFPASPVLRECAAALDVPPAALAIELGYDTPRAHGYTVDPARWDAVAAIFADHGAPLYRLGEVTRDGGARWRFAGGGFAVLPSFSDDQAQREGAVERWRRMVRLLFPAPVSSGGGQP